MAAFRILLSGRRRGCPWTAAAAEYLRTLPSSPPPLPLPAIASSASSPRYFSNGLQPSPGVSRAPPPFVTPYPPPPPLEPAQETHPYEGETRHAPGVDADGLTIVLDRTSVECKYAKMQTILENLYILSETGFRGKINVLLALDTRLRDLFQTHRFRESCLTEVESDCLMHTSIGLKKLTNLLRGTLTDTKSLGKVKIPGNKEKFTQEIQLIDHAFESHVLKHDSSQHDINKYVKELSKLFPLVDRKLAKAYAKQHIQRLKKCISQLWPTNFAYSLSAKLRYSQKTMF